MVSLYQFCLFVLNSEDYSGVYCLIKIPCVKNIFVSNPYPTILILLLPLADFMT